MKKNWNYDRKADRKLQNEVDKRSSLQALPIKSVRLFYSVSIDGVWYGITPEQYEELRLYLSPQEFVEKYPVEFGSAKDLEFDDRGDYEEWAVYGEYFVTTDDGGLITLSFQPNDFGDLDIDMINSTPDAEEVYKFLKDASSEWNSDDLDYFVNKQALLNKKKGGYRNFKRKGLQRTILVEEIEAGYVKLFRNLEQARDYLDMWRINVEFDPEKELYELYDKNHPDEKVYYDEIGVVAVANDYFNNFEPTIEEKIEILEEYGYVVVSGKRLGEPILKSNSKYKEKYYVGGNMGRTKDEIWDLIIEAGLATEEELVLVTNINGYNMESLNDIIYARTGYRDIEQYLEEDDDIERH